MENFEPISVQFLINSEEAKAEAAKVKAEIQGVEASAEKSAQAVSQKMGVLFSDSAKEVEAYKKSVQGSGMTGALASSLGIDKAREQLEKLIAIKSQLEEFYRSGKIGAEEYEKSLAKLSATETQLRNALEGKAPDQQGTGSATENQVLQERNTLLSAVSDQYRGLLEEGTNAYKNLDAESKRLLLQLINNKEALKEVSAAQKDLNTRFQEGEIKANDFTKAQAALAAKEVELRANLKATTAEIANQGKTLGNQEVNFNKLDGSVTRVSRNFTSFAHSASMGLTGLASNLPSMVEEIGRMSAETQKLNAEGQNTPSVFKQVVSGILSWQTALMAGIAIIAMYRKEIGEWLRGLFSGKDALNALKISQDALAKSVESTDYKKSITELSTLKANIQLAKEGMVAAKDVIEQYNEGIGQVVGQVTSLNEVEQKLIDNADRYVQMVMYKAAAKVAADQAAEKMVEREQKRFELEQKLIEAQENQAKQMQGKLKMSGTGASSNRSSADNLVNTITFQLQELNSAAEKEAKEFEEIITGFQRLAAGTGLNIFDPKNPNKKNVEGDSILQKRQTLMDKLDALDAEYARKSLTKDEEELQALRDKFAKARELVERFNADPKNKEARIDLTGLDEVQTQAESDLLYRQETKVLTKELEERRKLYEEYEAYKAEVGRERANERYGQELDTATRYIDLIQAEYDQLAMKTEMSGPEKERFEFLISEREAYERKDEERRRQGYDQALKDNQTFQEKFLAEEKRFQDELTLLLEAGEYDKAEIAKARHREQMANLKDQQIKSLGLFQDLFGGVERMGVMAIRRVIQESENLLNELIEAGAISETMITDVEKRLADSKQAIIDRSANSLFEASRGFNEISRSLRGINNELGQSLQKTANMMTVYGEYVQANLNVLEGALTGDPTALIAGITGLFNTAAKLFTISSRTKDENRAAREEIQKFYDDAIKGEMQYQALMRQREMDQAGRGETAYNALIKQLELLKFQAPEIEEAYNKIFSALQGQEFVEGQGYKHGTWFRSAKTWDIMASLAGSDYERLEKLYMEGRLEGQAKADFEALKALREELESVGLDVEDLQRQLNEMLTGTNNAGLSDAMTDLFRNGKMAAQDFGDSFEEIMRRAIQNTFRYQYMEEAMQPFYEELARMMNEGTPTEAEINELRAMYEGIGKDAAEYWKQVEEITGVDLSNAESSQQRGLQGAIRREMTEATASELAGLKRADYDLSKRNLELNEKRFMVEKQHFDATMKMMQHSAMIEANTAATVVELRGAVTELKTIAKNTKKDQTSRDFGI
ncbi:coiled-coil domain-containing protein [Litoribacter populi]|uniref:hypothetical protein n=1 Tax=Litoribacter populi TaxID=2598460 RepID=UPI00117EDD7E|nr:hypothetical protein [Litoribacter populi]